MILRFAFLLGIVLLRIRESEQGKYERKLLDDIFNTRKYNEMERPAANESDPVVVNFGLTLKQIIDVDEKNQIINTNIWLNMEWYDSNLAWNVSDYGGLDSIRLPASRVWKPDILMYNSADESFDGTFHTNVVVNSSGGCLWVPPGMFKSTCIIDIEWFPFDEQNCKMKFGSWTYDASKVDLRSPSLEGDLSQFQRNGEWTLLGIPGKRNVQDFQGLTYIDLVFTIRIRRRYLFYLSNVIMPCAILSAMSTVAFLMPVDSGEKVSFGMPSELNSYDYQGAVFQDIDYYIKIRRRALFYVMNVVVPCILISTLTLLTFTLPCESGEKVSLGVTILLSLTVFSLLVAESMPPTSDAVPLIGVYFGMIMAMCSLSVVFTVLVLNYHHRASSTHTMPIWVKRGICVWLAWILRMDRPGKPIEVRTVFSSRRNRENHAPPEQNSTSTNFTSPGYPHPRSGDTYQLKEQKCSQSLLANVLDLDDDYRSNSGAPPYTNRNEDYTGHISSPMCSHHRSELTHILKEIRYITDKMHHQDTDDEVSSDWKFAAAVIDRMCLIFFVLFTVIATVAVIFRAPHLFD